MHPFGLDDIVLLAPNFRIFKQIHAGVSNLRLLYWTICL
jgi:hypothetical protein